jgi:hypothetical protein
MTVNHKLLLALSVHVGILGLSPELLEPHTALPEEIPAAPCGLVEAPCPHAFPRAKLARKQIHSSFLILLPLLGFELRLLADGLDGWPIMCSVS